MDKIRPGLLTLKEKERYYLLAERCLSKGSPTETEYNELVKFEEIFVSLPIMVWSDDLKLAVLHDETLYIYQKNPSGNDFEKILSIDILEDLCEKEPSLFDPLGVSMDFWSNDLLLFMVNNNSSIWKLDLREYFSKKETGVNITQ